MGFESANIQQDAEEIEEQVADATNEADPSTYSLLPPENMRVKFLRGIDDIDKPLRTSDGEVFYELDKNQNAKGQQAITRMLKGIITVSDIVSVKDGGENEKHYSWKLPLKKIKSETTKSDVVAEQALFEYLFNSTDHAFNEFTGGGNNVRYENDKVAHFDFGDDAANFLRKPQNRDSLISSLEQLPSESVSTLLEKVAALHERFEGEAGKEFFSSIVDASDTPVTELFTARETFEKYHDMRPLELAHRVLMGRIEGLQHTLEEIKSRRESPVNP